MAIDLHIQILTDEKGEVKLAVKNENRNANLIELSTLYTQLDLLKEDSMDIIKELRKNSMKR
ncbi:hypothetical protein H6501_05265 [Candidatus Woesearchaeota archaeon]|nr:hypothetical protein [Candidatus Woesearchaeota archaeon]USN44084.1 MAG: hypothetical protein H6500_06880 [Candidatus Woesearchaeota archaeon]